MITRGAIRDFFRDLRRQGVRLDGAMRWSFCWIDREPQTIDAFVPIAEASGLTFVQVLGPDDEGRMFIELEEIAIHSEESMYQACRTYAALAAAHGIEAFDGFDVANLDGSILYA